MHENYMNIALNEAFKAYKKGEIPVGCVIVKNNKVISKKHNLKETKKSVLCHAEILAINHASKKLKNWRLNDCDIYVTMIPCPMCASAIKQARIKNVYYGVDNKNNEISKKIFEENDINEKVNLHSLLLEGECKNLLQKFFKNQRNNHK